MALATEVLAEARRLNLLGEQLRETGRYPEAEQAYLDSLALAPQLDATEALPAIVTDNLGTLYAQTGRLPEAIDKHRLSLQMLNSDNALDRAIATTNLGMAYNLLGDLHAALECFGQARQLHESSKNLTKGYLGTLLDTATVQSYLGNSTAATDLVSEALQYCTLWEQRHPGQPNEYRQIAEFMDAQMLMDSGDLATAAPLIEQAATTYTALMGPTGELALVARAAWARLLRLQNDPRAEAALLAVLTDLVAVDASSSRSENLRYELALLYATQGRVTDEAAQLIDNMSSEEARTSQLLPYSARRDQIKTVVRNQDRFVQFMALLDRAGRDHVDLAGAGLEHWLRRKAATADILREFVDQDESAPATPVQQELSRLRTELAEDLRRSSSRITQDQVEWETRQARVRVNRAAIDELERSASRHERLDGIALLRSQLVDQLSSTVPAGCVLLEFCSLAVKGGVDGEQGYGVFVVRHSDEGPVQFRYLDSYNAIDGLVQATLDEITASASVRGVSRVSDEDLPADDFTAGTASRLARLAAAIEDVVPVGTTRLIVSADADLCALPFQLLPRPDGTRWIDAFAIAYVSSGSDLVARAGVADDPSGPAVVVAGPQFSTVDRTEPYPELRGARSEGLAVAERLGVPARLGPEATRAVVVSADRPGVLHLATHGFYAEDRGFDVVLTHVGTQNGDAKSPVIANLGPTRPTRSSACSCSTAAWCSPVQTMRRTSSRTAPSRPTTANYLPPTSPRWIWTPRNSLCCRRATRVVAPPCPGRGYGGCRSRCRRPGRRRSWSACGR